MIRLIVTADDFGGGPGRNAGIVEAFRNGIVTGTTLLANGDAFSDAIRLARSCGLPVGVHLNLSEGLAVTRPIAGLTDSFGCFPGKAAARKIYAAGHFDTDGALGELLAQIARVRDAGLEPTHLDTHQHCALFPAITPLVIEAARRTGIDAARCPCPAEMTADDPSGTLGEELTLYRQLAPPCVAALRSADLRLPQGLFGMPLLNRLDETTLLPLLSTLPDGCWELMTHPGYPDPEHPFGNRHRQLELQTLTAATIRHAIAARGIELITFRDVACAS